MSDSIYYAPLPLATKQSWRERLFPNYEWVLLVVLVVECLLFSLIGNNFLTSVNAFEVLRSSVEVGLLALALTPVIISGGIDLSVGSMMGLAAVVFGSLWRDLHLPLPLAALGALLVGLAGGALNGLLISRLELSPLIVTLGTFSLFRGVAEGLTRGVDNYSGFPAAFLTWGQGYIASAIPVQVLILLAAVVAIAWCLHRTAFGRTLYAIGCSAEGARYAGVPVARRLAAVYVTSGLASSLAAIIYVAHLGQAKSDAGTGYELLAITAVVLGGASISGGRGTVLGTVLGLYAIVILENGLRLSGGPAELTGILTGLLLLITVGLNLLSTRKGPARAERRSRGVLEGTGERGASAGAREQSARAERRSRGVLEDTGERGASAGAREQSARAERQSRGVLEDTGERGASAGAREQSARAERQSRGVLEEKTEVQVKNSQVAVLSAVILTAAILVAGSNWFLLRSLRQDLAGGFKSDSPSASVPQHRIQIAMMPKAKGDPYFISCRQGAEQAAKELGVDLLWDGPTDLDPAKQNEVIEAWITRGVDVIAVSVENKAGISTVLRKARSKGIRVITWDADAEPDARDFFVNQATPEGIGYALTDETAGILNNKGEFAIVTASLSAANQNEWIKYIKQRLAQKYPQIKLDAIQPSDGDRDRAFAETQTLLKVYPQAKVIMGIAAPAVPGAAEAVKQSGRTDVKVTGLSLPTMCKPYVKQGVIKSVILWNTVDLGYLTVYASQALSSGKLRPGDNGIQAGRLGTIKVAADEVRLGAPFVFDKNNIDGFNF
jgi:ribose/xylose/arabinose/galactoside ABC-type transport system permease subunit/ABC-type sugar transport system substrate-binding protein